ncbi:flagellar hook-length control protein FliK [Halopseudomonas maritima]|nr:flagellar hook-length control protein FliK [Halopseudomonas maritima]
MQVQSWLQQLSQMLPGEQAESAETSVADSASSASSLAEDPSVLAEISAQWQRWLAQLPPESAAAEPAESVAAVPGASSLALAASEAGKLSAPASGSDTSDVAPVRAGVALSELVSQLRAALRGAEAQANADVQPAAASTSVQPGRVAGAESAQRQLQDTTQPQQRVQAAVSQPLEAGSLGRMVEQLEARLAGNAGRTDAESGDAGKSIAAAQLQQSGQAALSARPVTAPTQSLGVPMGQAGWSEAVVNKVMWMSSQNLQSVEIQLDPAELGPLEIKIQTRGQEHQVQFVSQHAGVRDALEGQMYRLREMFTQQGVGQLDVNVSDGSSQQRQSDGGLLAQGDGRGSEQRGGTGNGLGGLPEENPVAEQLSPQALLAHARLVDYYA